MTVQFTITNTSNWAHQPILVEDRVLQPGESITLGLDKLRNLPIRELKAASDIKPFAREEPPHRQLLPRVKVEWEEGRPVSGEFQSEFQSVKEA